MHDEIHNQVETEHRLTAVEKLAGSNRHRLDEVEKRQNDLDKIVTSVSVLKSEQEHIQSDVKEIKTDVKSLTLKPAKRWENLLNEIMKLLVAAIIGAAAAYIRLSI